MSKTATNIGIVGTGIALLVASFALAQNSTSTNPTPLNASCAGAVNQNVVTWTASAVGGNPPLSFLWSGANVAGATTSVVAATYSATGTFQASVQVTDTATSTASSSVATANCSATVISLPTATTTPPGIIRRQGTVRPPLLEINPAGRFLARGMIVQSVASTSFTAKVWGITWTVETAGLRELLFREGRSLRPFDISQILPGDEVSASGFADPDRPLIVEARVVRNFTVINERPKHFRIDNDDDDDDKDKDDDKKGRGRGRNGGQGVNSEEIRSIQDQIKAILEQIKEIQGKVRGRR